MAINHISNQHLPILQNIPYEIFQHKSDPDPEENTRHIRRAIKKGSKEENPFFIFANYSANHHPYQPSQEVLRKYLGLEVSQQEMNRLNKLSHPFELRKLDDKIDKSDRELLEKLYEATVYEVDEHLAQIVDKVKSEAEYDNTLLIVTADHGEALGEEDILGRYHFGHGGTIHNQACRVPLVISHQTLPSENVESYFPLKNIYNIIGEGSNPEVDSLRNLVTGLCADRALCEFPAFDNSIHFREKHPNIHERYASLKTEIDVVAGYQDGWRVAADSTGNIASEYENESADLTEAPSSLVKSVNSSLENLSHLDNKTLSKKRSLSLKNWGICKRTL